MNNWPTQPYDIVAAGKELGLSPKREATPWFDNKASPKDDWREKSGALSLPKRNSLEMPRRERLQEQLEREARDSRKPKPEAIADKLIEPAVAQLDDGWIAWDGSCREGPSINIYGLGEVKFRDGAVFSLNSQLWDWRTGQGFGNHKPRGSDIIAYRVIQPKQEGKA